MELSDKTINAFDRWIQLDTWYTDHDLDLRRFYSFVWTHIENDHAPMGEDQLREMILGVWGGRLDASVLDRQVREKPSLLLHLVDFARTRPLRADQV